ncbi:UDP-N-acetylmuramoylalanyl-D-glutamate--2,6-diaminopimelate ligase [Halopseudomonas xinjiangensis]|uniref:UDP-N-acetylmuramoyl-L-alanyl-D-glutamate--2,6-diaminopimelate ligase n=1 Tax=Halopseudomonas xinjiangensis TaxID=487184 RepID=A0A1H1LPK8_9GAMM|nr:UDP-N-acetylmuramoyl-L-alanyl-D-glutamate--2,6-diaminopimelate ligase [Halopseudomonas xinjiangensis]SDR76436.1 UDP-N-acetylmuramoylalanyl-D-glutamate--2,6-diaminopimelate ligase [Halopseudomonas xinjiangensis]
MRLSELFPDWQGSDVAISSIEIDSRRVAEGCLFLAVPGLRQDGRDYIKQAIDAGASAIAYEAGDGHEPVDIAVPCIPVTALADKLSTLAGQFYGNPSQKLGLIGVTGTNGKTSVSQMLAQVLDVLGKPCGIIGTLGSGMFGRLNEHGMTTPDALRVQEQLARLQAKGAAWVAMEVSSHALDQGRVAAVDFDIGVFTNLSRDHLDYHGDMQRYGAAKARLFAMPLRTAVINLDDAFGRELASACGMPVIGYSIADAQATLHCSDAAFDSTGIHAAVHFGNEQAQLDSPLLGTFNLSNLLAVIGCLLALEVPLAQAVSLTQQVMPPAGRMQRLGGGVAPLVVVDYAHTPDALQNALAAVRAHVHGRLTCVFGCGGDRDAGKRPLMAQAAEQGADAVVVTDDNPRSEASDRIIEHIMQGFEQPQHVRIMPARAEAIRETIAAATAGDVILLAGKGHETYQEINGVRYPFNDLDQARQALAGWEVSHA